MTFVKPRVVTRSATAPLCICGTLPEDQHALLVRALSVLTGCSISHASLEANASFTPGGIVLLLGEDSSVLPIAEIAARHGCVPVLAESAAPKHVLQNVDVIAETGNAFFWDSSKEPAFAAFAATQRALDSYVFPFDWKQIVSRLPQG